MILYIIIILYVNIYTPIYLGNIYTYIMHIISPIQSSGWTGPWSSNTGSDKSNTWGLKIRSPPTAGIRLATVGVVRESGRVAREGRHFSFQRCHNAGVIATHSQSRHEKHYHVQRMEGLRVFTHKTFYGKSQKWLHGKHEELHYFIIVLSTKKVQTSKEAKLL